MHRSEPDETKHNITNNPRDSIAELASLLNQ